MMAQATRASLLASATVTARLDRLAKSACTQSASAVVLVARDFNSEVAPSTNKRRNAASPAFDCPEPYLAAGSIDPRRQPDPGGEMAAVLEQLRIGDERAQRGRADEPDARSGFKALALLIGVMPGPKLLLDAVELRVDLRDRVEKARKRSARHLGQRLGRSLAHDLDQVRQLADALGCYEPELGQMGAQRIHQHGPVLTRSSRERCSVVRLCCSTDLTGTKRMVGRLAASHIASASILSLLPRFT